MPLITQGLGTPLYLIQGLGSSAPSPPVSQFAAFRALFPAFANTTIYPDSTIQLFWTTATAYITAPGRCSYSALTPAQRTLALNQMTAHLLYLSGLAVAGNTPGVVVGATIDKVSVTIQPPPEPNQWQYWLNQSPYGQQLLALLQVVSVGGFYASTAVPGRAGFWFGNGM
jgi:Protein of unknown function (DUF4054)